MPRAETYFPSVVVVVVDGPPGGGVVVVVVFGLSPCSDIVFLTCLSWFS